jgi:hypothetical protein
MGYSSHDQDLDINYDELESAKLLDVDANALDHIAEEVKATIHELQNIL